MSTMSRSPLPYRSQSALPRLQSKRTCRSSQPNPTTWLVHLNEARSSVVHLRLTNVPGWYATVNGHPVTLKSWHDVMLQVDVPAGRNVLVLHYQTAGRSDAGLILAVVTAVLLLAGMVVQWHAIARNPYAADGSGNVGSDTLA